MSYLENVLFVWVLVGVFAAFVVVVAARLLGPNGTFKGLLASPGGANADPERLQLLLTVLFGAGAYVYVVLQAVAAADAPLTALPDIPDWLLPILVGSKSLYLAGKVVRTRPT